MNAVLPRNFLHGFIREFSRFRLSLTLETRSSQEVALNRSQHAGCAIQIEEFGICLLFSSR